MFVFQDGGFKITGLFVPVVAVLHQVGQDVLHTAVCEGRAVFFGDAFVEIDITGMQIGSLVQAGQGVARAQISGGHGVGCKG
jgi:hypothetical protein